MSPKAVSMFVNNQDLLTLTFLRLPSKSLCRFKSVSKGWLSLISSPFLIDRLLRRRQGLLIQDLKTYYITSCNFRINFIPLNNNNNNNNNSNVLHDDDDDDDYPDLLFFSRLYAIQLMTSSNGLAFCVSFSKHYHKESINCHVLNPTTRQFHTVAKPNLTLINCHFWIHGLGLIFDPSKSIHYKLVCLWKAHLHYQVEIYSSQTKSWKVLHCKSPVLSNHNYIPDLNPGIYWNDAIVWFRERGDCLIFEIQNEQMRTLPRPNEGTIEAGFVIKRNKFCFGESGGHLYAVEWSSSPKSNKSFRVYEMKEDFSGWLTKYTVNLSQIDSFVRVLSLVWTDDDEPYLVLDLGFQIVRSNLDQDKRITQISGIQPDFLKASRRTQYVYQYVECYSSVSPP